PEGTRVIEGTGYNGSTPGPTIRAKLGDTLVVDLVNDLAVPTTLHWHGLHVPWDMDGVTWMQDPVQPGDSFTYRFPLTQAGTFWYHPHIDTARQVDLGLYGAIVVEDPAQPPADHDIVAVIDDWPEEGEHLADTGHSEDEAADRDDHHGHEGLWTVNGLVQPVLRLPAGDSVRLRLVDASNGGYVQLGSDDGQPLRLLATDQGLLPAAQEVDRLLLVPGDRAELELSLGSQAFELLDHPYDLHGGAGVGDAGPMLGIRPEGEGSAPPPLDLPFPGGGVSDDPGRTDIVYVFAGDPVTGDWYINGEQYPDVTVQSLPRDSDVVIEVRNLSPTDHPFHLHGHSFEVLSVDGVAPAWRSVEDTVEVPLYGAVRLRLIADNPGDWMAHCHILEHAEGGMMTVLRVE
ncbi:MAG: multicopper oxidase family protein, partial [Deltaproteobacteria bacterium]